MSKTIITMKKVLASYYYLIIYLNNINLNIPAQLLIKNYKLNVLFRNNNNSSKTSKVPTLEVYVPT